jgi:ABC-type Fe3+-siderophore transport system permease subunit
MKRIYFILASILLSINTNAQTMSVEGFKFKQGNKRYSLKEAHTIMQNNTNANQAMWEARSKRSNSYILGGLSIGAIGIATAKVIKERTASFYFTKYNIPLMIGGLTWAVVAGKANTKAKRFANEAIEHFNKDHKTSYITKPEIFYGMVGEGIGIQIKF